MRKHIRKISLFVCILLVAAMLSSGDFAYAFMEYDEGEMSLLQEGDFDIEISEKHSDRALIQSVEEKIYQGLLNLSSSINISTNRIPLTDVDALLSNVINDNPDLFYVSSTYRTTNRIGSSYVYEIIPYYSMSKSDIEEAKKVFYSGVDKALSQVDSSMNDLQKALTIHDYICDIAAYPEDVENNDDEKYHSAYGLFLDGNAVCAGYTLSYSYLMHELGIECEYVTSSPMQHAWNKVKINGNWYNLDITYDNLDYNAGLNTYGSMYHCFFMKSDSYFSSSLGLCHYGGKTYDSCSASSTDMDDYFWDEVTARIFCLNGDFYYMKPIDEYTAALTKRTLEGTESVVGSAYDSASVSGVLQAYDENGDTQGREYCDVLIRLAYLDGRFYISSGLRLYSQLLSGKRYKISDLSYYSTGISVRDNNIVYNLYGYTDSYTFNKAEFFRNNITTSKGGYNNYPDINNDGYVNAKDYAMILNQ